MQHLEASSDACIRGYDKTRAFKQCKMTHSSLGIARPPDPTSVILDMQPTIQDSKRLDAPVELPPSSAPLAADAYRFVGLRIAA